MTRVEWFKKNVEHFAIYETYETEDFTDVKVYFNDLMLEKVPELQKNLYASDLGSSII